MITIISFGYKYGKPTSPKYPLIFDCRKVRNPFNIKGMRKLTGLDKVVQELVLNCVRARKIINSSIFPDGSVDNDYTIHFACTGGRHRSVAIAEEVGRLLREKGKEVTVIHRDLYKGEQLNLPEVLNDTTNSNAAVSTK